jgi:hypothetical protein
VVSAVVVDAFVAGLDGVELDEALAVTAMTSLVPLGIAAAELRGGSPPLRRELEGCRPASGIAALASVERRLEVKMASGPGLATG